MNRTLVALSVIGLVGSALPPQAAPATDIWLVPVRLGTTSPTLGEPRNVTDRNGYDNQPFFEPDGGGVLYTSQRDGQTDIYRIDLSTMASQQITSTPESEYSPTVLPGGEAFATIRVEGDGTQRLWRFRRDGTDPELVLAGVAPVGYQAWTPAGDLAMFVLGDPATLQLADLDADSATTVARDIGRSLNPLPDGTGISFLHRVDGAWQIRALDPETAGFTELGLPFEDAQDMAWTPDGRIVMGNGSRLAIRGGDGDAWLPLGDLADAGIVGISRVAIHPEGTWIAVVAERG